MIYSSKLPHTAKGYLKRSDQRMMGSEHSATLKLTVDISEYLSHKLFIRQSIDPTSVSLSGLCWFSLNLATYNLKARVKRQCFKSTS